MHWRHPSTRWLSIPVILLGWSIWRSPWLLEAQPLAGPELIDAAPKPVALYESRGRTVYYTTADLLGELEPRLDALFFEIHPDRELEGHSRRNEGSKWVRQIIETLIEVGDRELAYEFLERIRNQSDIARGACLVFQIPGDAAVRRSRGLGALIALAIKLPPDRVDPVTIENRRGLPQGLEQALDCAFEEMNALGMTRAGIPYMSISEQLFASKKTDRFASWKSILAVVERDDRDSGLDAIVFGTFAMEQKLRRVTGDAFRAAWAQRYAHLERKGLALVHEPIRVSAWVMLFALAAENQRRRPSSRKRLFKTVLGAGGMGAAVVSLFSWLTPLVPDSDLWAVPGVAEAGAVTKLLIAGFCGWRLDLFVNLDD